MVEVIDDTVIGRSFAKKDGNIHEADGPAATLAAGVADRIPASFEVDSDTANWNDIRARHTAIHSPDRTTDPSAWRSRLERVFAVEPFLDWLALAAAIQHWDTYGGMTHYYFLYNDPSTNRLTWISWDHNRIHGSGAMGGMQPFPAATRPAGTSRSLPAETS